MFAEEEPGLPSGLSDTEPKIPLGLDINKETEPSFFSGMSLESGSNYGYSDLIKELPFDLDGFIDVRSGARLQNDPYERDLSIGEGRMQLKVEKAWSNLVLRSTTDFLYDGVYKHHSIDLKKGLGWIDIREMNLSLSPTSFSDIKLGRQVLTWGTGDLLFINDLFPKDWKSFFIGRDIEYLKAPSDAAKVSFYTKFINLDMVYTPGFNHDRYIDGRRISYWNPLVLKRTGENFPITTEELSEEFTEDEQAVRVFKNIMGYELAAYGYYGYWKSPSGFNPFISKWTFNKLASYGASIRNSLLGGIGNIEAGYYDSKDDQSGQNPLIKNSEARFLIGYEKEIIKNFTVGLQYYLEWMMDYGEYKNYTLTTQPLADEKRHVITLRLSRLMMDQNLKLSLFTFYSPSEKDAYIRPQVHYKISDHWSIETGGNIFIGKDKYTFFNQFSRNNNIYVGIGYGF